MKRALLALTLLSPLPAVAQVPTPPDPAFLQRALGSIQSQRNQALDAAAACEARVVGLTEDLAKAQARIKELEAKEAKPDAKQKP